MGEVPEYIADFGRQQNLFTAAGEYDRGYPRVVISPAPRLPQFVVQVEAGADATTNFLRCATGRFAQGDAR
ncbi:hypothetical protein HMPREF3121_00240 [Corynebacterium sp. HMSC11E11]|nr:hypothetical protein HMPREF3121_00240 [Corynebacterium sp. HMSC11E11]